MSESRHLLLAVVASLLTLVVGGGLLVWPNHRQTGEIGDEISLLEDKIAGLAAQTEEVERLAGEYSRLKRRIDEQLKAIPQSPDVAGLMRKLSLPVDGTTVMDQTFTAGSPGSAIVGEESAERAMPLTVDMKATFDSVLALIRAVESIDRLIRVASVRMVAERDETAAEAPLLTASVGLEVIYEPPIDEEGN